MTDFNAPPNVSHICQVERPLGHPMDQMELLEVVSQCLVATLALDRNEKYHPMGGIETFQVVCLGA